MASSLLPPTQDGYLPYFLLSVFLFGLSHTLVSYLAPIASLKAFSGPRAPPKAALCAHVYGVKNIYTNVIRAYAAYNIHNGAVYDLAIWTFVGVLALYGSECFWYRTVRLREAVFPFATAGTGLVWMFMVREEYLG